MTLQTPNVKLRFDWNELLQWEQIVRNSARILLIVVVSYIAYSLVKLLVRRIVSHEIDSEDPIVKRLREQRAQTLGSLLASRVTEWLGDHYAFVLLVVILLFRPTGILGESLGKARV